jgi:hypothetical protein
MVDDQRGWRLLDRSRTHSGWTATRRPIVRIQQLDAGIVNVRGYSYLRSGGRIDSLDRL